MHLYPVSLALLFIGFITFIAARNNPTHSTGSVSINCGSSGASAARDGREWLGDVQPKLSSLLQMKGSSTTSSVIHKLISADDPVPHKTARLSHSRFSYAFQVNPGQKVIRLHFNPAQYKGFKRFKDLFFVEAGPFMLLSNFSASLFANALGVNSFVKEFVPASLSYYHGGDIGVQVVGKSPVYIDNSTALEIVHRINIKQDFVSSTANDIGNLFGSWEIGPDRKASEIKNITWKVSVDVGFKYLVRLHFSEIGFKMAEIGGLIYKVHINEIIVNTNTDIVTEKDDENSIPRYRDYLVMMKGRKQEARNLLICMESNDEFMDGYGPLKGFDIMKLSNPDNSLASPHLLPSTQDSSYWIIKNLVQVLG
ncbi:UNVERIFIED_CONTAM: putative receptor-like protein kinase [Sesamum radiatum]|uniref:Receptor-like protein kinase n=1 Tax=Sesamum radiatum TaxID=300843 RepID=A0AAW2WKY5_SESRA